MTSHLPKSKNQSDDNIRRLFSEISDHYAGHFMESRTGTNHSFRKRLVIARKMTEGIRGNLLDVACGPGHITVAVFEDGCFRTATLIDISPEMLDKARSNFSRVSEKMELQNVDFTLANVFDYHDSNGYKYDLILVLGLIAHTGRLDDLLGKLRSMLAPGGAILMQSTLLDHWGTKLVRLVTRERHFRTFGYRIHYYTMASIRDVCRRQGLRVDSHERFCTGFPFGDRMCERANHWIETRTEKWAARHGSEAMFLLRAS
jgi:2-polyprenyl-3-methyl-5-hydroxy-6-metoxy-1,4-benzoquinol methylase